MKVAAFIPARMKASRFPGKPLAKILGLPMIEHVRRRVALSDLVDEVYVATCDNEIWDVVSGYGGKVIMTSKTHERCTDRIEEAARDVETDIAVIIQGDEPLFAPETIGSVVKPMLERDDIHCTNLLSILKEEREVQDVNNVKAVLDPNGFVLYYSRSPIPYPRVPGHCNVYRQTGLSAFRKDFLIRYSRLTPTPLEITESVDFQRILENRYSILGIPFGQTMIGVDRPEDVARVEEILKEDPVQNRCYKMIVG